MRQRSALASSNTSSLLRRGLSQTPGMKPISVALACLLLAATWPQDVDSMSMHVSSSRCCYSFVVKRIPLRVIRCYTNTSSTCSHKGIILKLKEKAEVCASGEMKWVKNYLNKMKYCPLK